MERGDHKRVLPGSKIVTVEEEAALDAEISELERRHKEVRR